MSDIVVSQLGARMHYAVPRIVAAANRLAVFYTDICASGIWGKVLRAAPQSVQPSAVRRLAHRRPEGIPKDRIATFATFGLHSAVIRLRNRTDADVTQHAIWAGERFSELVVHKGFQGARGIYAFAGDALEQIQAAKRQGLWAAVEQMNAPRAILDRLVADEEAKFPDWPGGHTAGADPCASQFAARERAEWDLADLIFCPSEFVRRGVAKCGGPVEKCVVVPYGVDARYAGRWLGQHAKGPIRVLTVGNVGLRKGSPYVAAAAQRLKRIATFRIVGACHITAAARASFGSSVEIAGVVPRGEMAAEYARADVFLLPSVCEGSATVVYEALSAGLPAIVTENTGSVVRDDVDGFVVKLGDVDAIVDRISALAADPAKLEVMSLRARRTAADYTIARYSERLLAALPPRPEQAAQHGLPLEKPIS